MSDNLTRENDFVKRVRKEEFKTPETITFKHLDPDTKIPATFELADYDWYMVVALEKADKVQQDRHLLTNKLLLRYRSAIREGFNHQLDPALKNRYDFPRNQNTVKGIQGYINRMAKASDKEMESLNN